MRESEPRLCWRLSNDGEECCIRDRGHDNGAHEEANASQDALDEVLGYLSWIPPDHAKAARDAWAAVNERVAKLHTTILRAAFVAENLHGMIDRETWRASGGDDMQGHYEGDYRAEQIAAEIKEWRYV
jgi:hypothetical protein